MRQFVFASLVVQTLYGCAWKGEWHKWVEGRGRVCLGRTVLDWFGKFIAMASFAVQCLCVW